MKNTVLYITAGFFCLTCVSVSYNQLVYTPKRDKDALAGAEALRAADLERSASARKDAEEQALIRKERFLDCLKDADDSYSKRWDKHCKAAGSAKDCTLDGERADTLENIRIADKRICEAVILVHDLNSYKTH